MAQSAWKRGLASAALILLAAGPAVAAEPVVPMRVVQVGEVAYISGGRNRAERKDLEARAIDFKLQVNFSAKDADPKQVAVTLQRQGERARPVHLTAAGPVLLVDLPSGAYTLSASIQGAPPVASEVEVQAGTIEQVNIQLDAPRSDV
jgi:hypothetical protein